MFDGILIIDKPEGITSHDVVAKCRRILKTKKIGHTGTLDPFATGVVVILVGKATRLAQFLDKDVKEYDAVVRLGFETDTGDRTGMPKDSEISDLTFEIKDEEIEAVLQDFRGEIMQTPPMYSAKKVEGKKLYELARKGIEIERKSVKINIYELELKEKFSIQHSAFSIRVACSAGTYIRVLAEDIGKKLNIGAHLAELRRIRAGKFTLETALTLEELEQKVADGELKNHIVSMSEAISHLTEIKLTPEEIAKIKNGIKLRKELEQTKTGDFLRLTDGENLLAIGFYDEAEKTVQPKHVLV